MKLLKTHLLFSLISICVRDALDCVAFKTVRFFQFILKIPVNTGKKESMLASLCRQTLLKKKERKSAHLKEYKGTQLDFLMLADFIRKIGTLKRYVSLQNCLLCNKLTFVFDILSESLRKEFIALSKLCLSITQASIYFPDVIIIYSLQGK